MSDETKRSERGERRARRASASGGGDAGRSTSETNGTNGTPDGHGGNKAAGAIGELAADLLKRAASPTVLGAAAGAAAAARLASRGDAHAPERSEDQDATDAEEDDHVEDLHDEGLVDEGADDEEQAPGATAGEDGEPQDAWEDESTQEDDEAPLRAGDRGGLMRRARRYATELTGRTVDCISAIDRADGRWRVAVEVVELPRIPSTTDVLASYELVLDDGGELLEYRRTSRYYRNSTSEERLA